MEKQTKTIKMNQDDWTCIGLSTGWIEKIAAETANYNYFQSSYQRPMTGSGDNEKLMEQQIQSQQQWTAEFMKRMTIIYQTLQQDIKTLTNMGLNDPRVDTLKNNLMTIQTQMNAFFPQLTSLKTDIDTGAIIENEISPTEEDASSFTMNSTAPANQGIQGH